MKKVDQHWKQDELIGVDSLLRADGSVVLLDWVSSKMEGKTSVSCFPVCDTTVESLARYNPDIWTSIQPFTEKVPLGSDRLIEGGEGGMGNEGFLACTDSSGSFEWALFFTRSNPFHRLQLHGETIVAFSSLDLKFVVDSNVPFQ
ncbi:MAG: hypothetical protein AAFX06_34095, partial [Planctomycetota bacterium]